MAKAEYSSLTKEFPLEKVETTITAITPGMPYGELLDFASRNTISAIPGLLRKRWLIVDSTNRITYDQFLSLVAREGIKSALVRKVMYFTWAYRDDRIRNFILERIANSNGKWNLRKLTNKSNADFFEQGGAKARSNFEYFLVEAKIFDPRASKINLGLDDGWLEEAARIAAQHEDNPADRLQLLSNPYKFLVDKGWGPLVNASDAELLERDPKITFEANPIEDDEIEADAASRTGSKPWSRAMPKGGDRTSTSALIDLVKRERASKSHYSIEKLLADAIRSRGHEPLQNTNIDLFFTTNDQSVLIEVKSCTESNIHSQVRKGVSQLLEYRHLYANELASPTHLVLALETKPGPKKLWLIKYLNELDISLAWFDKGSSQMVSTQKVPDILDRIIYGPSAAR